jgi:hypothetical protein
MTPQDSIQSSFLDQVRKKVPPNVSFVDELAEILNISRDSAYRRMRAETVLSLDEVKKICTHFGVSLDSLLSPNGQIVSFHLRALDDVEFTFEKYLKSILGNLEMVTGLPDTQVIYHAKDLPIFHYFLYPELAMFKIFFWVNTFTTNSKIEAEKYHSNLVPKEMMAIGERIWDKYALIHSTEIIGPEVLNITLRQISFARESGIIELSLAQTLCDHCVSLLNDIRKQAEQGSKKSDHGTGGKFEVYLNEVVIGDNTIFFKLGDKRVTYITHNNFNILTTSQESFCRLTEKHLENMMNKSIMISNSAAKERSRFFNELLTRVQDVKSKL